MGIIIAIIALLALWLVMAAPSGRKLETELCVNYAHRGLHGELPENSLGAFKSAVESGFGIELDVQLSHDGEVFVFHDYSLERMTGDKRKLSELTADELSELRLAATDEPIPRFSQVLELVNGRVPLLIELKGESVDCALCGRVAKLLENYGGAYTVESFNPMLLRGYKRVAPRVRRGQLYTNLVRERKLSLLNLALTLMLTNCVSRPDFIAYDRKYSRAPALFLSTRLFRAKRFVWTVRSREEMNGDPAIFESFLPK